MIELIPLPHSIHGAVELPSSKSVTNRALILAALSPQVVTIQNPLFSDDTQALVSCLNSLGIKVEKNASSFIVHGNYTHVKDGEYILNAHLSGTTIRFLTAFCCIVPGIKTILGEKRLNERPIKGLVDALRQLGAKIEYLGEEGFPPIKISTSQLENKTLQMDGSISSQFVTAIMLLQPVLGAMTITFTTPPISKSYIELTKHLVKKWGTKGSDIYKVEGDYSAAGYFAAIASLTNSTITLKNLKSDSQQGDRLFLDILKKMGTEVTYNDGEVTICGHGVKPVEVNMEQCPDQAQTLAVLTAFANGKSVLSGVRSLRVKETERVKAVQAELEKMNIKTESPNADTLIIYGGSPKPATIETYGDHRMAMSFAIGGSKLKGMKINNPEVVTKTFPEFWEKLQTIGIEIVSSRT
ncbi:MAG: 3-phosphoshikimate 1-carboxyvinyltransferase [bacterium]|nr:3-phosphoshikimate 1-carboxyvinyltransferase [bacterium]